MLVLLLDRRSVPAADKHTDIEATNGPFWLYGTAVEHHTLYQYQLVGTNDVFMGQIQTETPLVHPSCQKLARRRHELHDRLTYCTE
jgi:hypothetical protein